MSVRTKTISRVSHGKYARDIVIPETVAWQQLRPVRHRHAAHGKFRIRHHNIDPTARPLHHERYRFVEHRFHQRAAEQPPQRHDCEDNPKSWACWKRYRHRDPSRISSSLRGAAQSEIYAAQSASYHYHGKLRERRATVKRGEATTTPASTQLRPHVERLRRERTRTVRINRQQDHLVAANPLWLGNG